MRNLEQDRADVEAAQKEAREANAWLQFLMQHPEISNVESNRRVALEYHNGTEMTLSSLLDSFNSPAFQAMLAYVNPQKERADSLKTIQKITGVGETPLTKWTPTETLVKKATELEERRELAKKSPDELRQILKDAKPTPVERDLPVEMTRNYLLKLPPADFRRVIDKYGTPAVNRRLAGVTV
jgi:hypothetical protein